MATCPECDAEIEVDEFDVDKGDVLSCPECGSSLEVASVSPVELDLAPEEEEEEEKEEEEIEEASDDVEADEFEDDGDKDWEE